MKEVGSFQWVKEWMDGKAMDTENKVFSPFGLLQK